MKTLKTLFPFIAVLGVFFLANTSERQKQMYKTPQLTKESKQFLLKDLNRIN